MIGLAGINKQNEYRYGNIDKQNEYRYDGCFLIAIHMEGLMLENNNSSALAMQLRFFYIKLGVTIFYIKPVHTYRWVSARNM